MVIFLLTGLFSVLVSLSVSPPPLSLSPYVPHSCVRPSTAEHPQQQVTRAFSFNKTPMKLIRRPVMSPQFGSTNSLTPASQLAKMKLASCTNINVNIACNNEHVDDSAMMMVVDDC